MRRGLDNYPLTDQQLARTEAVAVVVRTEVQGDIAVISAYHPPGSRDIPDGDLEALFSEHPRVVSVGDFNATVQAWNSRLTNRDGLCILQFMEREPDIRIIGPTTPTYYDVGRSDVLDIAILKNIDQEAETRTLNEGSTNHSPVLISLGQELPTELFFVKRRTEWEQFRAEMQRTCNPARAIETTH